MDIIYVDDHKTVPCDNCGKRAVAEIIKKDNGEDFIKLCTICSDELWELLEG